MPRYKWTNPHDWLFDYLAERNGDELRAEARLLAENLDADHIQDLYQAEMVAEGYFVDLDEEDANDDQP